jgi:hypothetical protein
MNLNEFFSDLSFCFFILMVLFGVISIFVLGIILSFELNMEIYSVVKVCSGLALLSLGLSGFSSLGYLLIDKIEEIKQRKVFSVLSSVGFLFTNKIEKTKKRKKGK